MMKRLISFVLVFVLLLSVLPGAMAQDVPEWGLYLDAELTQKVEAVKPNNQPPWTYVLDYTEGQINTYYFFFPDGVKSVSGSDCIEASMTDYMGGTLATLTVDETVTGRQEASFSCVEKDDQSGGGWPVILNPVVVPEEGVYLDDSFRQPASMTTEDRIPVYTVPYYPGERGYGYFHTEEDLYMNFFQVQENLCHWSAYESQFGKCFRFEITEAATAVTDLTVSLVTGDNEPYITMILRFVPQKAEGLYLDAELTQKVELQDVYGDTIYVLDYEQGKTTNYYYYVPNTLEDMHCNGAFSGSISEYEDGTLITLTVNQGAAGQTDGWIEYTTTDGKVRGYSALLNPTNLEPGIYEDQFCCVKAEVTIGEDGIPIYTIPYSQDSGKAYFYYTEGRWLFSEYDQDLNWYVDHEFLDGRLLTMFSKEPITEVTDLSVTMVQQDNQEKELKMVLRFVPVADNGFYADQNLTQMLEGFRWSSGPYGYVVSYTPGQAKTLYIQNRGKPTYEVDEQLTLAIDGTVAAVTLPASMTGIQTFDIKWKNTNGGGENYPICFIPDNLTLTPGLYTDNQLTQKLTPKEDETYEITVSERMRLYYIADGAVSDCSGDGFVWSNIAGPGIVSIHVDGVGTFSCMDGENRVMVRFTEPVVSGERDIVNTDLIEFPVRSEPHPGTLSFQLPGDTTTYYMGVSLKDAGHPGFDDSMGYRWEEDPNPKDEVFHITFWRSLGDNSFARITDEYTLDKIRENSNLTLEMLGVVDETAETPTRYPAILGVDDVPDWMHPMRIRITERTMGDWLFQVTGDVGDQKNITFYKAWQTYAFENLEYTPPAGCEDPVAEINRYLENFRPGPGTFLQVNLPAATIQGHIVVPASAGQVELAGVPRATILQGSICVGGMPSSDGDTDHSPRYQTVNLNNIYLQGAGKNNKKFEDGYPNQAVYGNSSCVSSNCTFSGYDVAVTSYKSMSIGNYGSTYMDNNIAILINTQTRNGGNPGCKDTKFINNNIALDFEDLWSGMGTTWFEIRNCSFLDNKKDVRNKLKRRVYLPGNFFGYTTSDGDVKDRPCNSQVGDVVTNLRMSMLEQPGAVLDTEGDDLIHVYPRATDQSFNEWVAEENIVVSSAFAGEFPIEKQDLDGTSITVMESENEVAQIVFPETAQPSASLMSLMPRFTAQQDGPIDLDNQFNPSVSLSAMDDGSMVFTMNHPLGLKPTVRIPISGSHCDLTVTDQNGNPVDAWMEDGYLAFEAPIGGEYQIHIGLSAVRQKDNSISVDIRTEKASMGFAAIYDKNTHKMLDVVELNLQDLKPITSAEYDLSQCEIKIFLMDGNNTPVCEAATP